MQITQQGKRKRYLVFFSILTVLVAAALVLRQFELNTPKLPIGLGIEVALDWSIIYLSPILETMKLSVSQVFKVIETAFLWLPWPVWIVLVGLAGWRSASRGTALALMGALLTIQAVGLWDEAMSTVALVTTALILTVLVAIPIGIVAARNDLVEKIVRPLLDAMQTIPSLTYLIPVVMLLGVGKVPAVIATMVFAIPPAIRLTNLGLRQVSATVKEAAIAFGASGWQLLMKVEIPLALRTIMAGINQSTMMAVSMVIIAAFIGAGGLGYSVLFALNRIQIGPGFEAALAILAIAIVLDRLTQSLAKPKETGRVRPSSEAE
ncbi:MAG: ABC transporter permease subunit [Dehalococcoidales bacterium]|nr:ABC transporter permease subunit [Dehalococcoidales bacterium]